MRRIQKKIKKPKKLRGEAVRALRTKYKKLKRIDYKNVCYSKLELEAIKLPEPISPLEFLKVIKLPRKHNIKTELDIELTPYLEAPIECIADYKIETIIIIKPTQSGGTVVIQVAVAWSIDQDPGPMTYSGPDEKTVKKNIEEKVIDMITSTPCLKKRIRSFRDASKSGIKLDTMTIFPAWSRSIPTYGSSPKKRIMSDEVRLFDLVTRKETNAIKLADDRLTTYKALGLGQHIMVSSPSTEGDLLHQQLDIPGTTVLKWWVPCPKCNEYQILDFFINVKKPDKNGKVKCRCKYCEAEFKDDDWKKSWNNLGTYAPEDFEVTSKNAVPRGIAEGIPRTSRMAFWWNSEVSPFRNFERMWKEFKETKDKPHDYLNFKQCWLAQFNEINKSKNTIDTLKTHKLNYNKGTVPNGVKILLAGIDTQDDALFYTVFGFGFKTECWLIDEGIIPCDIDTTDADDLEDLVLGYIINRRYLGDKDDRVWKVALGAWDAGGHRTKQVQMVVKRLRKRIVAIHGRGLQSRSVVFSKKETHYNVRSDEYLIETEDSASKGDNFHLPQNVSYEFLVHFTNKKRAKEIGKDGRVKWSWTAIGADHLRMAACYTYCCLDIPMGRHGDLRSRLRSRSFELNPSREAITAKGTFKKKSGKNREKDYGFDDHERAMKHREKESFSW